MQQQCAPADRKQLSMLVSGFEKRMERELPALVGSIAYDFKIKEEGLVAMRVDKDNLVKLCRTLKEKFDFDHCTLISAVDWIDKFELVYHLYSSQNYCMAEIKVRIPKDDARVQSVTPLWGGANWHEREAYDMMGIAFVGHPDHRRILLPQDYKYFPLRKDFDFEEGE